MTLQQLRYITAVNRFRSFAKAADSCNVTQPTLSAMIVKLEEEIDIRIFERTNKSVSPTLAGMKIIRQAENILMEIDRIGEIVSEDKGNIGGASGNDAQRSACQGHPDRLRRRGSDY